jgi:hypothetical protein
MITTLVNGDVQRGEACQAAEPEYVAVCRSAAGVSTSAGKEDE